MRKLHERCVRTPVFRTLAGSVVVCDAEAARRVLADTGRRLDHVPAFWRPGNVRLPPPECVALNRWVHTCLADEDPGRAAADAVETVAAARGDLHRACLHAVAGAHRRPLGLENHSDLRATVGEFLDHVFHDIMTGARRFPDLDTFQRLTARAGRAVADGAVPGFPELDPAIRGEVYLRAVTAFAGASAAALAWLICAQRPGDLVAATRSKEPVRDLPPEHVALETLRLWPPAWQHRRPVRHDHRIGGLAVLSGDEIVVPAYALQRHPRYWPDADLFDPGRWARIPRRPEAFLPFATGPGACVGARFEVRWLAAAAAHLAERPPIPLARHGEIPCVTAVFSPPRHTIGPRTP
ncbi:cytochrome P450 [Amycolatopsis sp. 195334CR]|uniref:cytochrome P450 n=1 Tax=Amycolatopsis sp. 195334CR TaxID=2814588 RepID=UPI001A8E1F63|nr:cytochrome P450 [Amycolatopsis sp. 195334CR]MBN6039030.1 cytochrome P450 [Amycolatopsis sp. 195334CR]